MCSLLQSGLLKGKLLAAWVCTVSYEHRPRDCWGNEISRTCPLRDSTDAVRAGQQYPPAPRAAPLHVRTRGAQPQCERGDRLQTHPEADRRWHRQGKSHSTTISAGKDIPGSSTASQRRARPSSTNTISSPRRKPSNRSTRPSPTSPRRWSSTRTPRPDDA